MLVRRILLMFFLVVAGVMFASNVAKACFRPWFDFFSNSFDNLLVFADCLIDTQTPPNLPLAGEGNKIKLLNTAKTTTQSPQSSDQLFPALFFAIQHQNNYYYFLVAKYQFAQ